MLKTFLLQLAFIFALSKCNLQSKYILNLQLAFKFV